MLRFQRPERQLTIFSCMENLLWEGNAFGLTFTSGLSLFYFRMFFLAELQLNFWTLQTPIKLEFICSKGNMCAAEVNTELTAATLWCPPRAALLRASAFPRTISIFNKQSQEAEIKTSFG